MPPECHLQFPLVSCTCSGQLCTGERLKSVEVPEGDLEVSTMRSGGAGGQHVNKTESAVRVKHIPTGTAVRCDAERSQLMNKVCSEHLTCLLQSSQLLRTMADVC